MSGALARRLDRALATHGATAGASDIDGDVALPQLATLAESIAQALRNAGCGSEEPVAVYVSNRARDLAALWGVWKAGAVAAPLHRTTPEIAAQGLIARLKTRFVLDTEPVQTRPRMPGQPVAVPLTVLDRPAPPERPLLQDGALIVFTSGTTGQPKGAVLSHTAFAGKLSANQTLLRWGPETRTLLVLQMTFSFGMWVSLLTLVQGGWLHMEEKFVADRFLPALANGRITDVAIVPTMIRALLASADESALAARSKALDELPALRQVLTGGENLGSALGGRLMQLMPHAALFDIYGLTETSTCDFFLLPQEQGRYPGCIGRPAPNVEFRIAREHLAHEPDRPEIAAIPGEAGELQIRTPYLMNGYLDAPEATQAALCEGFFRTGDIARERERGVVELVGRTKELISRGGVKVSPLEIEHVLAQHPGVGQVLATGIPDAVLGERIHALVVPRPGATVSEDELLRWAGERLERFKRPDRIHFGTELPLGRTGKSDRIALRTALSDS